MASAAARPIRVAALTPGGATLARKLCQLLPGARCWLPRSLAGVTPGVYGFERVATVLAEAFGIGEDLVCIMAAGIVVRGIAPHLRGKDVDPAVVVVDEAGQFAVSLLSGHLGGANALARQVARLLDATPVITTATDVRGLPALDQIAAERGLAIENLAAVRPVHLALLAGQPIPLLDPYGYLADLAAARPELLQLGSDQEAAPLAAGPGVYVSCRERKLPPDWLILRPRNLVAGMGCHRGTPAQELLDFIKNTFQQERISLLSLQTLATIEARKDEPGLQEAARSLGAEFIWFTAAQLQNLAVPNPSPHAARHLGVASVSEAAALKAGGVELIVPKRKAPNATLAVARVA
jgi:cobalt-precorrin 5A hydrolase